MNDEPQTPWLTVFQMPHFSVINVCCLQAKLFLKNGFEIYFLMKTLTFRQWFSILNFRLNTCWVKKELLYKTISLSMRQMFFFKCPILLISKINWFLDLKRNKRLLDNKSWEPLNAMLSCMDQWLWEYIFLYNCGAHFPKK